MRFGRLACHAVDDPACSCELAGDVATLPAEAKAGVCPKLSGREMVNRRENRALVQSYHGLNRSPLETCSRSLTTRPHLARVCPLPAYRRRRSRKMPPPAGDVLGRL